MATYAIGDVQGCYDELCDLLKLVRYQPSSDRLWFCGDLVNRGKQSLAVLRFISELALQPIVVLGNHDLHLLAVAQGAVKLNAADTFHDVLDAADSHELCQWLLQQKILHHDEHLGFAMTHAGILPSWDLETAKQCAFDVEQLLQSYPDATFYQQLYGTHPLCWSERLEGYERIRFIVNTFTRMRYCDERGCLNFSFKGKPGTQPENIFPWFQVSNRKTAQLKILFGHWAALEGKTNWPNVYALDTGCAWGNYLSAFRLEDESWFTVPARL